MKPYHECPRFESCSVNDCPLSLDSNFVSIKDDPETKCRASKKIRRKIAAAYNLPNRGLTKKEIIREEMSRKAKERFKKLPEKEKTRRREVFKMVRMQNKRQKTPINLK